ncbi:MAG: FixH family protein [Melioribacteraceae bacterium]|nr:FixH family protein [Melioribacteraceae bacterium]
MKLNWGSGIAITYILFMAGVIILVVVFMNQDVHLVTDDYYAKEIEYQQQIDKVERTKLLKEQPEVTFNNGNFLISFPRGVNNIVYGKIQVYRPSDSNLDKTVDILLDAENRQSIGLPINKPGLWKVKMDWIRNDTNYYNEKIILSN